MAAASLIDAGADVNVLMEALNSLNVPGFDIRITRKSKAGIDCCDFDVVLDAVHDGHDHDMEYLYGHAEEHEHSHEEEHGHSHEHNHEEEHEHSHVHNHAEGHAHHEHRGLNEINAIIDSARLTDGARNLAHKIFDILAEAESKAHAVPKENVHFHEVGAVDSIVDIVAAAVCIDNLNIDGAIVPFVSEGTGTVRCQHGILPIPVPAVANIVRDNDINIRFMDEQGEFVTPTGAAIVAAIKTSDKLPDNYRIESIGYGVGKREYNRPNFVRAMLINVENSGENDYDKDKDCIYKLETNIDDCSGECLGLVMDKLLKAGARDVFYTPIYMKKNRPAYLLSVICTYDDIDTLENIIFNGTTTIGIRRCRMERTVLPRQIITIDTPYGQADVKKCIIKDTVRYYPEYDSIVKMLENNDKLSYSEAYRCIIDSL